MSVNFENGGFVNMEEPKEVTGEYTYDKNHPRIKYHHESTSNDLEYYGSVETGCKTLAEFAKALPVGVYAMKIKTPQLINISGCEPTPVYMTQEMVMDTRTNNHEVKPIWRKYKDSPIISIQYRDGWSGTTFYVKLAFKQKKNNHEKDNVQ
jgi:hypothetical protein